MTDIENPPISNELINLNIDIPDSYCQHFQKISKLSWQMSASYTFFMQLTILVYLLSQLDDSEDNLAAITLITSLINAIVSIGASPLLALSLVAGKELGELQDAKKNGESSEQIQLRQEHLSAIFGNGLIMAAITAPFMISSMVFSKSILINIFNQNHNVAEITQNFIRPYSIAMPALMVRICADQVMFTFERTKPAMMISLSNFAFSMTLGSILAFGKLGAPKMGTTGILIGCILDSYLTSAGYLLYLAKSPRLNGFNFFDLYKPWQPYLDQLRDIRNLSRTIMFSMSTETMMNFMINSFAGMVGVQQQSVFSAVIQFSLFSLLLQIAFGQTAAQEISRAIGANLFKNASRTGKTSLIAILAYVAPVLIMLSAYPNMIIDILGINSSQTFRNTLQYLAPIMFIGCILDASRFLLLQELRVLGDSQKSSLISSGCIGIGIFLSGMLGLQTKMGIYGVATGYAASNGLGTAILLTRWLQRIEPQAIEENKKNPEQFFSIKGACGLFFKSQPKGLIIENVIPKQIQMNPIISAESVCNPQPKI